MTSYGPPGQPPGPQPGPPPGPTSAGGYGPPPAGSAGFDAKQVNPLDWGLLAVGVLSLIFSFFSYYSYTANRGKVASALKIPRAEIDSLCAHPSGVPSGQRDDLDAFCNGVSTSAWHGFFGWFGVLLALLAAALVALALFAPSMRLPFPVRLAALGAFVLAVISTLIALLVVPDYQNVSAPGGGVSYDDVVNEGHGFSYWIVLVLIVVGLVLAFLRFQQTGGQLPGRTGTAAAASPTGYDQPSYQQPPTFQQPPSYQPQPQPGQPQPGYSPPVPPQPGYAPPVPPAPQPGYQQQPPPPAGYAPPPPSPSPSPSPYPQQPQPPQQPPQPPQPEQS